MSVPGASSEYILARRALLDALSALKDHLDALVLVGAQAIYLHTGEADVAIATHTKDSDLAVDPAALTPEPLLEEAMRSAGFHLSLERRQPGEWVNADGVPVDLLVPEALGGAGRRGARIPPHDNSAARKVLGLEAALVDNDLHKVGSLEASDERLFQLKVAGPSALLISKLHKLGERHEQGGARLNDKDAHDVYRLLQATETQPVAETMLALSQDPRTAEVTLAALAYLRTLFDDPTSPGSVMAGRAERGVGDPDQVSAAVAVLSLDLLNAVEAQAS